LAQETDHIDNTQHHGFASAIIKDMGFGGSMAFTDYFHLIKEAGQCKIVSKTFTTE